MGYTNILEWHNLFSKYSFESNLNIHGNSYPFHGNISLEVNKVSNLHYIKPNRSMNKISSPTQSTRNLMVPDVYDISWR